MNHDLLRNIPMFAKLPESNRVELVQLLQTKSYAAYQPIFWVGENGDEMYIVQSGKVRLSYPDEAGNDVTLAVVGPGAFFGEIALLDSGPRTATARAETEAVLLSLSRDTFYRFLEKNPAAAIHMIQVLSQRQRTSVAKLRGVRNVNEEVESHVTPMQRLVDRAAEIGASGFFLLANIAFIIIWVTLQTAYAIRHHTAIIFKDDPPTFFWLGFMIALEGILLTMFVLNSQKRQAERDRIRADLEYQVNLKAQTDVMLLHQKVDKLMGRLGIDEQGSDRQINGNETVGRPPAKGNQDVPLQAGAGSERR